MIEDNLLPERFRKGAMATLGAEDAGILMGALCEDPETCIRVNLNKSPLIGFYPDMEEVPWCTSAFYLSERPRFTSNPLLHAGAFYVQDASSTVYETIVHNLGFDSPVRAADLCAAPGGKTTAVVNALPDGSVMLANEFVATRAGILKENLIKYGYPHVVVTNSDVARLSAMNGYFDLVTIDAPCSGEGMMRKDETARTQWSEGLVRQCAALQREIIDNAVEMLAPGGYLIYSTCTFNTQEDEDNAAYIADAHGLVPLDTGLAGKYGIRPQVSGDVPCLRFMPGFTRGEGLFVAVFRKPADAVQEGVSKKNKKRERKSNNRIDAKLQSLAQSWVSPGMEIRQHMDRLLALSPDTADLLDRIPKDVRIIMAGVETGEIKGKDLVPAHQLALSTCMSSVFPAAALSAEDAVSYLSREAIVLPPDTPRGFVIVTFEGFPLGFVKNLGNRSNNLYPQEYRIRRKG